MYRCIKTFSYSLPVYYLNDPTMKVKGEKGVSTKKGYKNKYYLSIVLEVRRWTRIFSEIDDSRQAKGEI